MFAPHLYRHHEEICLRLPPRIPSAHLPIMPPLTCPSVPAQPFFHFLAFLAIFYLLIYSLYDQGRSSCRMIKKTDICKSAPSSRQAAKFLTATTLGATLLFLSGLTMTGRVIALIMATPLIVLFSPILVPTGIVIFLVITGLLFSGGCGVAAITSLSWIYYYVQVKHPPGADQLDYSRKKLASTARDMTEKAKEYGQCVQHKAQEVAQGQGS